MIADQQTREVVVRAPDPFWLKGMRRQGDEVSPARSLQKEVLTALMRSGYAALSSIGCEVNGERVILFGVVPTYHLKQLAQVFAQRIVGEGKVVNQIAVFT
jgi:osmotically-inducible protein OsmY